MKLTQFATKAQALLLALYIYICWSRSIVLEDTVLEAQWAHADKNYSIIIAANILCFNNPYSDFLK